MTLDRLDAWILDLVVEMRVPMSSVVHEDPVGLFNREGHGASTEEVVEAFVRLARAGLVHALRSRGRRRPGLVPLRSRDAVSAALTEVRARGRPTTLYALTRPGGRCWEEAARPDWSRFFQCRTDLEGRHTLRAATKGAADRYLAYLRRHWTEVVGRVAQRPLAPWHATYWKTLPAGFELTFRGRELTSPIPPPADSEFFRAGPRWYDRPW